MGVIKANLKKAESAQHA